jgi:hypothetical protein
MALPLFLGGEILVVFRQGVIIIYIICIYILLFFS